jgi:hypothetical protein
MFLLAFSLSARAFEFLSIEFSLLLLPLLQRMSSAAVQNYHQLWFLNHYRLPVVDNLILSAVVYSTKTVVDTLLEPEF